MITVDESNEYDVHFGPIRAAFEDLIEGMPEDPRQWEIARDGCIVFSISEFMKDYSCGLCNKSDFGWMRIGHKYIETRSSEEKIYLTSACCKCGTQLCSDPDEAISYMLSIMDKEEASIVSGSMWKKAANGRSFWGYIGKDFYQAGPMKKNPSIYWASNPDGFLKENFETLEAAKSIVLKPALDAIKLYKHKLRALYK